MNIPPVRPLVEQIWIVVQENEGLIVQAFPTEKEAISAAKKLVKSCPSMRTEIAKYSIAMDSVKSFGALLDDSKDNGE